MNHLKRLLFAAVVFSWSGCQPGFLNTADQKVPPMGVKGCNLVVPPKGFSLNDMNAITGAIADREKSHSPDRRIVLVSIEAFADGRIEVVVANEATIEAEQIHYVFRKAEDGWTIESVESYI